MSSNSSYMVQGEHDEVMTVLVKPKQPQLNTFTSDDPLLSSAQCQVPTSFTKKMAPSISNQLFSNENEKVIDNYDDQELLKILGNMNEDKFENRKFQKELNYQQTHHSNIKSCKIDNKAQIKDIAKHVSGTYKGNLQDKEEFNENEVLAYLEMPSYNSGNVQLPQNLDTSDETTIVLTSAEIFGQIVDTQKTPPQNPAQTEIVLTQSAATQNVDKQVIPCVDIRDISVNSINATRLPQLQGIPVQNTMMLPAQSHHVKKHLPRVYSWPGDVATTSVASSAVTATTSAAITTLYDAKPQQQANTQCLDKHVNTRNIRKVCSPAHKRSHEEIEIEDDNEEKDFQIKNKGKMNDANTNKKMKKWEIKGAMKDPVEEQKRLNAKKAHDHRMKEKREKETMKDKIKNLEQRVKDLETKNRVLNAENVLLKQFNIRL